MGWEGAGASGAPLGLCPSAPRGCPCPGISGAGTPGAAFARCPQVPQGSGRAVRWPWAAGPSGPMALGCCGDHGRPPAPARHRGDATVQPPALSRPPFVTVPTSPPVTLQRGGREGQGGQSPCGCGSGTRVAPQHPSSSPGSRGRAGALAAAGALIRTEPPPRRAVCPMHAGSTAVPAGPLVLPPSAAPHPESVVPVVLAMVIAKTVLREHPDPATTPPQAARYAHVCCLPVASLGPRWGFTAPGALGRGEVARCPLPAPPLLRFPIAVMLSWARAFPLAPCPLP